MDERQKKEILGKINTIVAIEDEKSIQKLYKMFFKNILGKNLISIFNEKELDLFLTEFEDFEKISIVIVDGYLSETGTILNFLKAVKVFKEKSNALIIAASSDPKARKGLMNKGAHKQVDCKNDLIRKGEFLKLIKDFFI